MAMQQREIRKQRTQRRILESACDLCAQRGFADLKTPDVAHRAQVSQGSVFVHFTSREGLLREVIVTMTARITDALHDQVARGGSLEQVLQVHLEVLASHEERLRWLVLEVPLMSAELQLPWLGLQAAMSFHVGQAFERDVAAGMYRPMPLHLLFNTWIGLVNHYIVHREAFAPGGSALDRHGPDLLQHFLGLLGRRVAP